MPFSNSSRAVRATSPIATSFVAMACVEIEFSGAFVPNRYVDLHAIDATPARWRGDVGSSPPDGASAATSSPRNAPDTLVDFHTDNSSREPVPRDVVVHGRPLAVHRHPPQVEARATMVPSCPFLEQC